MAALKRRRRSVPVAGGTDKTRVQWRSRLARVARGRAPVSPCPPLPPPLWLRLRIVIDTIVSFDEFGPRSIRRLLPDNASIIGGTEDSTFCWIYDPALVHSKDAAGIYRVVS